jgi:hypothetical protein
MRVLSPAPGPPVQQKPPNKPRDEFPDVIDYGALPPDHLLIPTAPKIIHVQPEQNSPLRGNSHLPGGPQIVPPRGYSVPPRAKMSSPDSERPQAAVPRDLERVHAPMGSSDQHPDHASRCVCCPYQASRYSACCACLYSCIQRHGDQGERGLHHMGALEQ